MHDTLLSHITLLIVFSEFATLKIIIRLFVAFFTINIISSKKTVPLCSVRQ